MEEAGPGVHGRCCCQPGAVVTHPRPGLISHVPAMSELYCVCMDVGICQ